MKTQNILWTVVVILILALTGVAVVGMSRLPSGEAASDSPPAFSLSPGPIAMAGPGAGYVFDYTQVGPVDAERLAATVEDFLERQDNPDLTLATLREFRMAYAADIVEKSTGNNAFGLMIGKAALQVSPKAGPNVFWNTKPIFRTFQTE